jgi:hypothetical protein
VKLLGPVGSGLLQLDTDSESAVRAQPGYSGSPVIMADDGGEVVIGMLAVASDSGARDAYALPVGVLADAWPDVIGQLVLPPCR